MYEIKCHCGALEAEINLDGDLAKVINVIVLFAKERAITSMVKTKISKLLKEKIINFYQFHSKSKLFLFSLWNLHTS